VRSLCHASLVSMAGSLLICLQMLQCAASRPDGMHGFQLSKSLQGMFELVYLDLIMVSQRGVWQQAETVTLLTAAAASFDCLHPIVPHPGHSVTTATLDDSLSPHTDTSSTLRFLAALVARQAIWPPTVDNHGNMVDISV